MSVNNRLSYLHIAYILLLGVVVSFGCRYLQLNLIAHYPQNTDFIKGFVIIVFSFLIVYFVMKPLAREFGYKSQGDK